MFPWSEKFETHIEIVDTQHKKLVSILNELCIAINERELDQTSLDEVLKELLDYAAYHFAEEEQLMEDNKVSEKHTILHKMEHNSFIYDIERMRNYFLPDTMSILEIGERLMKFVTAWLTYHILGIDKVLAAQIEDITRGLSPEKAYQQHRKSEFDVATTRLLLDAVLQMWQESNEHSLRVEQQLAQCLSEKN
jgi:hemerythrin